MSHTLLIDGNNLVAINTHTHSGLTAGRTFTGGVFGALRKIRAMLTMDLSEYDISRVVFVEDYGVPAFRKKLCPEYKTGRKSRPDRDNFVEKYRESMKVIPEFLRILGVHQAFIPGWEADDVLGYEVITKPSQNFVICSGDKDLLQLTRHKNCTVYQPVQGEIVERVPRTYLLRRCLEGDKSDDIKGVPGIGPVKASEIVGFVHGIWNDPPRHAGPKDLAYVFTDDEDNGPLAADKLYTKHQPIVLKNLATVRRNWKMMSLAYSTRQLKKQALSPHQVQGKFDEKAFKKICQKRMFASILNEFEQFVGPFRELN